MAKKLRIGIVGSGNIAQTAHLPSYEKIDNAEVVAVCDLNYERAQDCAKKFSVPTVHKTMEEMMKDKGIDAIDICCWNRSHMPVAIEAAKAGKHILCEKPMAWNLEHALQMQEQVQKSGILFMMAMPSQYRKDVQLLRQMVDEGALGDIYHARTASIRRRGTPLGWFTDTQKAGGGPVIDIGVHCIDRTWYLMGCPKPTRVSAATSYAIGDYQTLGVDRWKALDSDVTAFDTEDSALGVIHFENGAAMVFEVSWALNAEPSELTLISGSLGGARLEPKLTVYTEQNRFLADNVLTVEPGNPYLAEIEHFVDCVQNGKTPQSTADKGVMVQRMLQGVYDSAAKGCEVAL